MKKRTLILCGILTALLLLGCLALPAFAKDTVKQVVATSDLDRIAVLYGYTEKVELTLIEGEPVTYNQSWQEYWEKYNEQTQKWENYSGRLYPGKYRTTIQLYISVKDPTTPMLDKNVTCTVDGVAWTMDEVREGGTYSCVYATSPEIVIVDDPNVTPPTDVSHVYMEMDGYVAGESFEDIKLKLHLGSEDKVEFSEPPMFAAMEDSNGNGMLEDEELQNITHASGEISKDTLYLVFIVLRAKEGYDISLLKQGDIHFPDSLSNGMNYALSSYDKQAKVYRAAYFLRPCVSSITFVEQPQGAVAFENEESVTVTWKVNGAVSKYLLYCYDEEAAWDVIAGDTAYEERFVIKNPEIPCTRRYRIEAINSGEVIGTSEEFTVEWRALTPVTLPIRIDASTAAGGKQPVDLSPYYPTSEQYEFLVGEGLNCFVDAETAVPVTQFENGKEYSYVIQVAPKRGYSLDLKGFFGTPDSVRIYGIGWESITSFKDAGGIGVVFTFRYDESKGIPAEPEKLLNELVFDASSLVGKTTPDRIPDAIFAHEALTLCGTHCTCTEVPTNAKEMMNYWEQREIDVDPIPATAFLQNKGYVYTLYFHVADGWSVPGVLNSFDFLLSGTGLEAVEIAYNDEVQMLLVRLAFWCENENGIPAGAHACIKNAVPAKAPTCTENGCIAHYACSYGKVYLDKWGMHGSSDLASSGAIAATGHTPAQGSDV